MGIKDDAVEVRAQGWRTLAALHGLIEAELERSLQSHAQLSVVEYTVLDALIQHSRVEKLLEVRGAGGTGAAGYRYALTDLGRDRDRAGPCCGHREQ